MIQDIQPSRFDLSYLQFDTAYEDTVLVFEGKKLAVKGLDPLRLPTYRDIHGPVQYLFSIDETHYFLALEKQEQLSYQDIHRLRHQQPKKEQFAAVTAYHLYVWYAKHRYCGVCGKPMVPAHSERALRCPSCHNRIYPTIMPAIIVGVIHNDSILVTRYAHRTYKGHALIAGFCEIGETPEDTIRREVMEEVGLHVKNIRYYKSQPWGFDLNLLLGFFCELDGNPTITLEQEELAKARFISQDELNDKPDDLSLTNDMMMFFKAHGAHVLDCLDSNCY